MHFVVTQDNSDSPAAVKIRGQFTCFPRAAVDAARPGIARGGSDMSRRVSNGTRWQR